MGSRQDASTCSSRLSPLAVSDALCDVGEVLFLSTQTVKDGGASVSSGASARREQQRRFVRIDARSFAWSKLLSNASVRHTGSAKPGDGILP